LKPHLALDAMACPVCDLAQRIPPLPPGGSACCARCRETLVRNPRGPIQRPLALTVAAAIVFIIANTTPLMALSSVGRRATTTIIGGAYEMWVQGSEPTALAVAFCAVIAPGAFIAFMLTVLLAVRHPPAPRWVGDLLRVAAFMQPWSMNEVMLVGILVALIRISQLADVDPGLGIYSVGVLVLLLAAIDATFDLHTVWSRVEWADGTLPPAVPGARMSAGARG
jgi:paraquat-inducible protein A